ncbi:PadR family transcriptional regulator [Sediminibacillus halophilus]|uniref:DNA-binding transcriptional regulator, PadR family n=1 Tax=Sediminibacillus halophilus TaxID=482461 RepID=A0A1G9NMC1_9BACI|nr:PadR family transcriptional regulator [Sediminibacillus halophilus]SDL87145.1 DNA-binding transcriptional regulator, PadR family [Sediminibacillus halophilus]
MSEVDELVDKLLQELRRGTITIGVLSQLDKPQYGYSLVSILSDKGMHVEPGTLYPLLRRLEKQGLLESKWDTNEGRPRKYYLLSRKGKEVFAQLKNEWKSIVGNMEGLLRESEETNDGNG